MSIDYGRGGCGSISDTNYALVSPQRDTTKPVPFPRREAVVCGQYCVTKKTHNSVGSEVEGSYRSVEDCWGLRPDASNGIHSSAIKLLDCIAKNQ